MLPCANIRPLLPEGDTIFRAARTLHLALAGKRVTKFETVLPKLARVDEDAPLAGRLIECVESRGKNLLIQFSGGLTLRTHMRMNGSWHIYRSGERWQRAQRDMRIMVGAGEFVAVAFNVPVAEFIERNALPRHADLGRIGPDLLSENFDEVEALARMRRNERVPIADVLLSQRVISGIGNVYKSEILFLSGVNPFTATGNLTDEILLAILATSRKLMRMNVKTGSDRGIVTYTGFRRTTRRADPSERLWVYGRGGKPCRKCGAAISRRKQGLDARSTYWCPVCQKEEIEN